VVADPGPAELLDVGELLFRQVHSNFLGDDGVPAVDAFRPTSKDDGVQHVIKPDLQPGRAKGGERPATA